jgi:hypothetical protein
LRIPVEGLVAASHAGARKLAISPVRIPLTLCVPKTSSTSCDQAIFVDHATHTSEFSYAVLVEVDRLRQRFQRRGCVRGSVRPVQIVMGLVLAHYGELVAKDQDL